MVLVTKMDNMMVSDSIQLNISGPRVSDSDQQVNRRKDACIIIVDILQCQLSHGVPFFGSKKDRQIDYRLRWMDQSGHFSTFGDPLQPPEPRNPILENLVESVGTKPFRRGRSTL